MDYPDCLPEFVKHISAAVRAYNVELLTPLLYKSKREIAKIGKHLGINFDVTYSCYFDPNNPCGVCESCRLRNEALGAIEE